MEDDLFVTRIQEKVERMTGGGIELEIDEEEVNQLHVEFNREVPRVVLGANVMEYSGFARMGIEYAVASIREKRPIEVIEFHMLLARN